MLRVILFYIVVESAEHQAQSSKELQNPLLEEFLDFSHSTLSFQLSALSSVEGSVFSLALFYQPCLRGE